MGPMSQVQWSHVFRLILPKKEKNKIYIREQLLRRANFLISQMKKLKRGQIMYFPLRSHRAFFFCDTIMPGWFIGCWHSSRGDPWDLLVYLIRIVPPADVYPWGPGRYGQVKDLEMKRLSGIIWGRSV